MYHESRGELIERMRDHVRENRHLDLERRVLETYSSAADRADGLASNSLSEMTKNQVEGNFRYLFARSEFAERSSPSDSFDTVFVSDPDASFEFVSLKITDVTPQIHLHPYIVGSESAHFRCRDGNSRTKYAEGSKLSPKTESLFDDTDGDKPLRGFIGVSVDVNKQSNIEGATIGFRTHESPEWLFSIDIYKDHAEFLDELRDSVKNFEGTSRADTTPPGSTMSPRKSTSTRQDPDGQ